MPTNQQKFNYSLVLVPFLLGIGVDLFVPSLPAISHYFSVSAQLTEYTISSYMLGYALGQIFLGVLSDNFGRRKIITLCCFTYILVSLAAAWSASIYWLIFFRFLQGFIIAGPASTCRAVAVDCYSGKELSKILTYFATSWSIGPIIGPAIGGYLQYFFGWQASFYFFGIFGIIAFVYAFITLKETNKNLIPFEFINLCKSITKIICHPLFFIYTTVAALVYGVLVIFSVISPFLIQEDLNFGVIAFGHIIFMLGLSFFLGNLFNKFLITHLSLASIAFISLTGSLIICIILLILGLFFPVNIYMLLLPMIALYFLASFIVPNMMSRTSPLFPKEAGTSSAVFGAGTAAGAFIMSTIATQVSTHSQVPMATLYIISFALCLILLCLSKKYLKRKI